MILTFDYQIIQKTHRQHRSYLLDHMVSVSAALRAVHEQKKTLFQERPFLFEKQASEQWQLLFREESALLQELRVILAEIAALRELG